MKAAVFGFAFAISGLLVQIGMMALEVIPFDGPHKLLLAVMAFAAAAVVISLPVFLWTEPK